MALKGDLREIKNNNEFVSKREEILYHDLEHGRRNNGQRNLK